MMSEGTAAKLFLSGTLISSWWWLEPLQAVSQVAALLAPIVGLGIGILTLVRMVRKRS